MRHPISICSLNQTTFLICFVCNCHFLILAEQNTQWKWETVAKYDIHSKLILKSNLVKSHKSITYFSVVKLFWNFAESTATSLPCSVQNLETIWQLIWMLWTFEILRYLSPMWVGKGCDILLQYPEIHVQCSVIAVLYSDLELTRGTFNCVNRSRWII